MLILSRKAGQGVQVGDVTVEVVKAGFNSCTVEVGSRRHRMRLNDSLEFYGGRMTLIHNPSRDVTGYVRLGFEFPRNVRILRKELIA